MIVRRNNSLYIVPDPNRMETTPLPMGEFEKMMIGLRLSDEKKLKEWENRNPKFMRKLEEYTKFKKSLKYL